MRFRQTQRSRQQVGRAPLHIQQALEKQLGLLVEDLRHPSLRAKKYGEAQDIWQARVTRGWRLYFQIDGDTDVILPVTPIRSSAAPAPPLPGPSTPRFPFVDLERGEEVLQVFHDIFVLFDRENHGLQATITRQRQPSLPSGFVQDLAFPGSVSRHVNLRRPSCIVGP